MSLLRIKITKNNEKEIFPFNLELILQNQDIGKTSLKPNDDKGIFKK